MSSGSAGTALEHSVPEQLFSTPENPAEGISAVKALKIANDQGIPIYTITKENINTILPQLQIDSDDKSEIINAVNAGMVVTTSQSEITYNGWTGIGYIVIDPNTGAGGYMISGGMSGGILMMAIGGSLILTGLLSSITVIASFFLIKTGLEIFIAGAIMYFTALTKQETRYFKCILPIYVASLLSIIVSKLGEQVARAFIMELWELTDRISDIDTIDSVLKCVRLLS